MIDAARIVSRVTGRTARAAAALLGTLALVLGLATPAFATPASLQHQEWWIGRLGLQQSWKITKGTGVTVAVLDDGVDATVPDLRGAMVPGFAVGASSGSQLKITDPDVAQDARGHGTSMAVEIAGRGIGPGILGVAPEAKILPVLLFGDGHDQWAAALDKLSAMASPPQVVDLSMLYGSHPEPCPSDVQQAVQRAVAKGMILVAGAGDQATLGSRATYPASCKGVVAVGAFDSDAKVSPDSQRQPYVSLGGPGVQIVGYNRARQTMTSDSTTDAASIVAGEIALVRAHYPALSPRQVVARMFATASKSAYSGPRYGQAGDALGFGPAVAYYALTENVPANAPNPVYDDLAKLAPAPPASRGSATSDAPSTHGNVTQSFPNSSNGGSSGSNTGLIIGIVVAVVVVLLVGGFLLARRRGRHNAPPGMP